jgi:electron transfer flavoprotein alpha subunit
VPGSRTVGLPATSADVKALRVAVLIKQIPVAEELELGPDGRLVRTGVPLEINPYCRRAITKGVELAADGGRCVVFSLGPPAAEEAVREAVAAGASEGVLICDEAFAGSDTLATARTLVAALRREEPFDLVLTGLNSVDADTGQVGPEVAELLGWPFASGVRTLEIDDSSPATFRLGCERDDGFAHLQVGLPAVLSVAERLCAPAKFDAAARADVAAERIRRVTSGDLGPGPWGRDASPTRVGSVRLHSLERQQRVLAGPIEDQVADAMRILVERGAFDLRSAEPEWSDGESSDGAGDEPRGGVPTSAREGADPIVVLVEPERDQVARELLGAAARLAATTSRRVVAVCCDEPDPERLGRLGADEVVNLRREGGGRVAEEEVASYVVRLADEVALWAVLGPSTSWGRQVAARAAASLDAGLTGDAIDLEIDGDRLVAWKPAFGGRLVAAIEATSEVQMVTLRPGVLPLYPSRAAKPSVRDVEIAPTSRVRLLDRSRDDVIDAVARAETLVGVGSGVPPEEYGQLSSLLELLDAELVGSRKVTDQDWLPRTRQVGLTGHSVAPNLYVAIALSGKFNHLVGVRRAQTVLAVNSDPSAPVFSSADVGIVGDWREVVPLLTKSIRRRGESPLGEAPALVASGEPGVSAQG